MVSLCMGRGDKGRGGKGRRRESLKIECLAGSAYAVAPYVLRRKIGAVSDTSFFFCPFTGRFLFILEAFIVCQQQQEVVLVWREEQCAVRIV
jgi:hypothetical protein